MKTYLIVLALVALIAGGAGVVYWQSNKSITVTPPTPVACTMEAKLCPDGSAVGRQGPNCEFAECPSVMSGQLPINIKPNQIISLPFTLIGKASNQFEGQWGNVKMYDSLDNLLTTKLISIPCDYGKSCNFSVVLDGIPKTSIGYLIFSQDNPSGLPQYENSYRINIVFNSEISNSLNN